MEGIGQNRQAQHHHENQKSVATEAEQQQPGKEGVGDVEERFTEVAVMHQELVIEAELERETTPTEGELTVQNGALDLPGGRRKQCNGCRRHPEQIAHAGKKTFPERRLAGLGQVLQHQLGADAFSATPDQGGLIDDGRRHHRPKQRGSQGGTNGNTHESIWER